MTTRTAPWDQVSANLDRLGTDVRNRFEQAGADVTAERAAVEAAVQSLIAAIEDAFGTAGDVVRDPVLRKDLAAVAASMRHALVGTLEQPGAAVKQLAGRARRPAPARTATKASARTPSGSAGTKKPAARRAAAPRRPEH
ncbi:hypothetical protein M6B22_02525 [Jatrophihabitans cynanchi]|jgi:hypothetical protein|uniref:Uncharacterized protein n=1 Tax=Jatrophihabitans cynanchi TaxID=2944128 RepID=A0ABY7JYL8_9ACTN|nr:hypothetical protein [Jatrophihabitans sp. SB3-54]WAX57653.1 hypothetical protein M6B22_02525 [Jatrophihabitans sp. SB3-54]